VAYPASIAAGDLLLLHIVSSAATSSTPPSGWTEVYRETTVSNPKGGVYIKTASGSESGSLTVTMSSSTGRAAISRFTGVDATPQDVAATSVLLDATSDTTVDLPSLTTANANSMLVYMAGANSTSVSMTSGTGTERYDWGPLGGTNNRAGAMYTETKATAGSTGTRTITLSAGRAYWGVMLALREDQGGPPAFLGSLIQRVAGISSTPATSVRVAVKTSAVSSARLKLGTDSGLTTGVVFGSSDTPDADGYVILTATGLTANTRYYYRVEMTDANSTVELDTMSTVGRIKTAPSGQANVTFDFGSCANSTDPIVFPLITARADDMFFHLGDMFYNDGSGTTLSNIRSKLEGKIQATNHAALYAQINMAHAPSDHDVAQNDSNNGDDPTAWGNYRTASAQLFPDVDWYYSWVWGRVRFIKLDTKNFASDASLTDNSSKSILGTTQKAWFKDQIDNATEPLIIIVQSDPWIGSAISGDNGWFGFTTERTELANYMSASGKNFVIIAGDMHAGAADDGTNSPGGIPVLQAAPFGQTASQKGGPYTVGPVPSSGTAFTTHYGRVVITDNGSDLDVDFNVYDSTDTAVVTLPTLTFSASQDFDASASLSGSGTLTSSRTPAFSVTSNLSGSGTLTVPTRTPGASQTANLTGVGTLSSTRAMTASATGTLSSSGTLSPAVTVAFSRSGALSGSGTLVGSGVTPAITVSSGLSGSGTLSGQEDSMTTSVSAALSGSGTLTKAVVANFTAGMSSSSTGTLTATQSVSFPASVFFTSTGTLSQSNTPAITKAVGLSSTGTLSQTNTPAVSITQGLSGDGTLTAQSSNSFTRSVDLSGSGTLSASVTNVTLSASASLSGSGTLTAGTVNNKSTSANLSGSGALLTQNTGVSFTQTAGLSGSGTLSGSSVKNFTANPQLSGSGQLSVTVVVHKTVNLDRDGFGQLVATVGGMTATVSADLVGVGSLVGHTDDAANYTFDAYLESPRWDGNLGPQRWEGSLP
jgi:alkaline phosphatase D